LKPPRAICLLLLVLCNCVTPKIAVVDERTALENQILGSYEELDRNLQLIASVRTQGQETQAPHASDFVKIRLQAIQARQTQQFNRDDLVELKKAGCLGEGKDGLLAVRPCPAPDDPKAKDRLSILRSAENRARAVLWRFIVATNPDLSDQDLPQVIETFARLQREAAHPGEWAQGADGAWQQIPSKN